MHSRLKFPSTAPHVYPGFQIIWDLLSQLGYFIDTFKMPQIKLLTSPSQPQVIATLSFHLSTKNLDNTLNPLVCAIYPLERSVLPWPSTQSLITAKKKEKKKSYPCFWVKRSHGGAWKSTSLCFVVLLQCLSQKFRRPNFQVREGDYKRNATVVRVCFLARVLIPTPPRQAFSIVPIACPFYRNELPPKLL